ncbi:MAG: hypothetical protein P4N59_07395 [Negativicutes bacterium]|nr:hypothetical protein [Negativicutes bacterium]
MTVQNETNKYMGDVQLIYFNQTTGLFELVSGALGALLISQPDQAASGPISTQNLNATGAATVNSAVSMTGLNNSATVTIHITANTLNQVLTPQISLDGTNWVALSGTGLMNQGTGVQSATIPAGTTGLWQAAIGGIYGFRLVEQSACTGSATVLLQSSPAVSANAIDMPLPTGANTIGTVNLPTPTPHALTSAATTNATSVKASAGTLYTLTWDNVSASARYLKLYNKASAPTVGTDIPILTIPLAVTSGNSVIFGALGKRFSTGIAYAITGAIAVADTTAIAAGDVHITMDYV